MYMFFICLHFVIVFKVSHLSNDLYILCQFVLFVLLLLFLFVACRMYPFSFQGIFHTSVLWCSAIHLLLSVCFFSVSCCHDWSIEAGSYTGIPVIRGGRGWRGSNNLWTRHHSVEVVTSRITNCWPGMQAWSFAALEIELFSTSSFIYLFYRNVWRITLRTCCGTWLLWQPIWSLNVGWDPWQVRMWDLWQGGQWRI